MALSISPTLRMSLTSQLHAAWLAVICLVGLYVSANSAYADKPENKPCQQLDIATLESQRLGLASIEQHFNQLASATMDPDFSLASLFTIDLLDQRAVKERIEELDENLTKPTLTCSDQPIGNVLKQQQAALSLITGLRLKYLSLPKDERHYLVSLVSMYQSLNEELSLFDDNQAAFENDLETLKTSIATQEAEYKSLQAPDERTALFEKISGTKAALKDLKDVFEHDRQKAITIRPLLALTKALLIDYHNIYRLNINKSKTKSESNQLFQQLTSPEDLNALIRFTHQRTKANDDFQSKLAALIIIHGRIHTYLRQNESLSQLTSDGIEGVAERLAIEIKTLFALPSANIHFKLFPSEEHRYLSQSLYQSATNLAMQLMLLIAFGLLLKRLPDWINASQQYIVRNHLSKPASRPAISSLRFLQPNAQWLSAVLLYYYLNSFPDNVLRDWVLSYDIIAIAAFYLLIKTIASGAISNTNSRAHLFVLRSKQLNIRLQCHRFALHTTLISILYIVLETLLKGGIICTIYQLVLLISIWLLSYRTITEFQPEFKTHLSKRVSEQTLERFENLQKPFVKALINPIVFISLQLLDIINALHHQLLRIERYQTLTAKFLKIRLEQSQANASEPEQEEQDDTHYENWFLNQELVKSRPNLKVQSPWLQDMNQNINGWLEGKQDENDLALIGENGIGKSTLLNQWLEQWDKSNTVYIRTPSKTLKEHDIFNLVCEALSLNDCEDIAQFVTRQQSLEKTVIIIDEAHHLFLSDVGGFEAYKKLQDLISAKLKNIFWVVAINHQSWIYLNDVFSQTYQFSTSITMQRWTQQGIRDLVLRRHKASRRKLSFDELLLASTSHGETATRAAESRCFSLLWDQSSGIPSVALSIWINSARNPAKGLIEMGVPERPNSTALNNLSDDHLFVYAALVVHESLNTQQAHAVTHLSEAIVRRTLKQGLDQGFLKRKSHGRYIINPLWQIQLCQLLRRKNFLHE